MSENITELQCPTGQIVTALGVFRSGTSLSNHIARVTVTCGGDAPADVTHAAAGTGENVSDALSNTLVSATGFRVVETAFGIAGPVVRAFPTEGATGQPWRSESGSAQRAGESGQDARCRRRQERQRFMDSQVSGMVSGEQAEFATDGLPPGAPETPLACVYVEMDGSGKKVLCVTGTAPSVAPVVDRAIHANYHQTSQPVHTHQLKTTQWPHDTTVTLFEEKDLLFERRVEPLVLIARALLGVVGFLLVLVLVGMALRGMKYNNKSKWVAVASPVYYPLEITPDEGDFSVILDSKPGQVRKYG
jgi:hypothetical protein